METSATIGRGTCSGVPAEAAVEEEVFDARRLVGPAGAALACQAWPLRFSKAIGHWDWASAERAGPVARLSFQRGVERGESRGGCGASGGSSWTAAAPATRISTP